MSRTSFADVNVTNYLRANGSGVCLDLQVIDNVPGSKVEEDSETHHMLAENLYKPRRRYQSHYSRHFMPLGETERQDREVFQRNMKIRMETSKSLRHKRHKRDRSLKKQRGSDIKEDIGGDKSRSNLSQQNKDPAGLLVQMDQEKAELSDEDVGITFTARKAETPKPRPKSASSIVPPPLEGPQTEGPALPSGAGVLPWKGGAGVALPCVSVETKIIPVDLQQAWNQSISSLESVSLTPAPTESVLPRVSALSRLGAPRPASYTPPGSVGGGAQVVLPTLCLPGKKKQEEDEEEAEPHEMQPLMSSLRPPPSQPPPPPCAAPSLGRRNKPSVYLRSLMSTPPSRGPTHL